MNEVPNYKTGIKFMIFILIFVKIVCFDAIHNFSVWLRTGTYLVDINLFRSHTGKVLSKCETGRFRRMN